MERKIQIHHARASREVTAPGMIKDYLKSTSTSGSTPKTANSNAVRIIFPRSGIIYKAQSLLFFFSGSLCQRPLFHLLFLLSSVHLQPGSHNSISNHECIAHILEAGPQGIQWQENPQHIKEDQIYPQEHEVARIEILVAGQPFGGESHEA